jgi:hypothetical protein
MPYRLVIDGNRTKIVKGGIEEARLLALQESESVGKSVSIEEAEAGDKWTEIEIVFPNGADISTTKGADLPDTGFGGFDREPVAGKSPSDFARDPKKRPNSSFFS